MEKHKKILLLSLCCFLSIPITSYAGWENDNGWQYRDETGVLLNDGWKLIGGKWYCFSTNGKLKTGMFHIGDATYITNNDGVMYHDCMIEYNGKTYRARPDGSLVKGWSVYNNKWIYFSPDYSLNTLITRTIDGEKYHFDEDGNLLASCFIDGKYMTSSGLENKYMKLIVRSSKTSTDGDNKADPVSDDVLEELKTITTNIPDSIMNEMVEKNGYRFVCYTDADNFGKSKYEIVTYLDNEIDSPANDPDLVDITDKETEYIEYEETATLNTSAKEIRFTTCERIPYAVGRYYFNEHTNKNRDGREFFEPLIQSAYDYLSDHGFDTGTSEVDIFSSLFACACDENNLEDMKTESLELYNYMISIGF